MKRKHRCGVVGKVVLCAVLSQAACLVLDEDHCLSNGGDLACGGAKCVMQTGPNVKTMSDDIGCAPSGYDPTYQLRLPFGLPAKLESPRSGVDDLDSLEGVLTELIEENGLGGVCDLDDDPVEEIVENHDNLHIIRSRLDSGEYIRKARMKITETEVAAVKAYGRDVSAWLNDCREKASVEASGAQP